MIQKMGCAYLASKLMVCQTVAAAKPYYIRANVAASSSHMVYCRQILAFAYPSRCGNSGTELEAVIMNENRKAIVCADAVYDPENLKPRSND